MPEHANFILVSEVEGTLLPTMSFSLHDFVASTSIAS
jgi:hypothetical protein